MSVSAQVYKPGFCRPGTVTALHVCLIMLLGLLCYSNSFSVPFMFDDFASIIRNPDISGGRSLLDILTHGGSRRIADISFLFNYRLHGLQPAGYHVVNLAIHITAALVLYFLTVSLLDSLRLVYSSAESETTEAAPGMERFIPLAAALIFVSHPLQTQAVTYIVQRHTSLATLFYLLTVLAYLKCRICLEQNGLKPGVLLWGFIATAMSLLAFHTKQITFTIPLMIVMLELSLFRGRFFKRFLIVNGLIGGGLFLTLLLPALLSGTVSDAMLDLRHATAEDLYFSRSSYFLTQIRVVATYLRLLVMPVQQNLDYDYPIFSSLLNAEVIASLVLHGTLLATAFLLYFRSHQQLRSADHRQGSCQRLISLGVAWFYIALIVESSFIPITDVIMEHRLYLPSAGFAIVLASLLRLLSRKFSCEQRFMWIALAVICIAFSLTTITRNRLWNDEVLFWQDAAGKSPRKGRVLSNLGVAHLKQKRFDTALRLFVAAIKLDPTLNTARISLGSSLKGMTLYQGRFTTGMEFMTPAGDIDWRWYRRFNSTGFNNMGLASEYLGQPEEALKWYVQSVSMTPDFDLGWFNLGLLSVRLGHNAQADAALLKLQGINPDLGQKLAGYIR